MPLTKALAQSWVRDPAKIAVACGESSWTYAELDRRSERVAGNLLAAGAEPGDRVAVHLQNGLELALVYVGCLRAGCVLVPLNTRLKGREIDYVLRHSGSAFYIGEPELHDAIADTCPALASLQRYSTGDPAAAGVRPFAALLRPHAEPLPAVSDTALAAILYTSGTTAHPKGVMHSHETLRQTALVMQSMGLDQEQVVLVMSSMAHMIGFAMLLLSSLVNGATAILTRPGEFGQALDAHARWRCTFTVALPVLLRGLLEEQLRAPRDVSSGRYYYGGGDSVAPALQEAFQALFQPIGEAYGATEAAPLLWNRPGNLRVGTLGQAGDGIAVRLATPDGADAKPGEIGEIWVRAPHRMEGYWQDPEATHATCPNGWFRTGDLARCDAGGFYWFAGRQKEMIVRGGSNISPQEVEAALYEHPGVAEAGVVGKADAVWGETVIAHVAPRPGEHLEEVELLAFVRSRLADYKVPEQVIFHAALPRTASGKIQRRALREQPSRRMQMQQ